MPLQMATPTSISNVGHLFRASGLSASGLLCLIGPLLLSACSCQSEIAVKKPIKQEVATSDVNALLQQGAADNIQIAEQLARIKTPFEGKVALELNLSDTQIEDEDHHLARQLDAGESYPDLHHRRRPRTFDEREKHHRTHSRRYADHRRRAKTFAGHATTTKSATPSDENPGQGSARTAKIPSQSRSLKSSGRFIVVPLFLPLQRYNRLEVHGSEKKRWHGRRRHAELFTTNASRSCSLCAAVVVAVQ